MKENKPLVSASELDALIIGWGETPSQSVDRFFPLRFWYLFLLTGSYAVWLLFWTDAVVNHMQAGPGDATRMARFLYFRGWFLLTVLAVGAYAYFNDWYFGVVFLGIFLLSCVNFAFDLFNVYGNVIAHPTPRVTIMLLIRMVGMWMTYLCLKNASRLPEVKDRMNIMLPFRRVA